jgi:hypothetical protein
MACLMGYLLACLDQFLFLSLALGTFFLQSFVGFYHFGLWIEFFKNFVLWLKLDQSFNFKNII